LWVHLLMLLGVLVRHVLLHGARDTAKHALVGLVLRVAAGRSSSFAAGLLQLDD
jgi:hypothetical protein